MTTAQNESFLERFTGVISLKRETYAALQRDTGATLQALIIVMFVGLANGIAIVTTPPDFWLGDVPDGSNDLLREMTAFFTFDTIERQISVLVVGVLGGVLSWAISSWLLKLIGNRLAGAGNPPVSTVEMRRLVGWGYAPLLASFFAPIQNEGSFLATAGALLALAGTIWSLVTGIMAVRTAFNVGIGKAILIEILAVFVIFAVVMAILILVALTLGTAA